MSKTTEPTPPAAPAGTPPAGAAAPPPAPAAAATFLGEPPKAGDGTAPAATPPAAEKPPEKKGEGEKPAEKPAEKAKLEVKFAEDLGVSEAQAKAFTELAQSLELDSAKAQKLVDHYAGMAKASREAAEVSFVEQQKQLRAAIEADKELGGANAAATRAAAHKALAKFGSPGLTELLDNGLGNHLDVVRFLAAVGKAIGEDSVGATKTTNSSGELTEEQLLKQLYPSMHKES